jgi:hypothetical protein
VRALKTRGKYAFYVDAINYGVSIENAMNRPDDKILCHLHLHKRVIEKVAIMLFTRSVDELKTEVKKKRLYHILKLETIINHNGMGSPEKSGIWKCPIKNLEEVGECKFMDVQAERVEKVLCIIIDRALTLETSKAAD